MQIKLGEYVLPVKVTLLPVAVATTSATNWVPEAADLVMAAPVKNRELKQACWQLA